MSGKRINANTAQLSGQTAGGTNKIMATVQQRVITLKYLSRQPDGGGSYEGTSTLKSAG
ncbi:MAG: hypothetical protein ACLQBD_17615 [Syntrophobacteraceae bacterium]